MPKILVEKAFPFSPDGNVVITVDVGEQEVSDRCARVAVDHLGVATLVDGPSGGSDLKKRTMAELKALLTAKGIPFDKGANKEALLALVPNDD